MADIATAGNREIVESDRKAAAERARIADERAARLIDAEKRTADRIADITVRNNAANLRDNKRGLEAELLEIEAGRAGEERNLLDREAKELKENPADSYAIRERTKREVAAVNAGAAGDAERAQQREAKRVFEETAAIESDIRQSALRAAGNDYQADVEAFEAAAAAKVRAAQTAEEAIAEQRLINQERAERDAAREQMRDDVRFDARQMALGREGKGEQADREAVLRGAKEELEAAKGDPAMQQAIADRTKEELLSIQNRRAPTQVMGATEAFHTDLRGETPLAKELNELNRKQLDALLKLVGVAEKTPVAVTS
jgi:hypothetical protein